MTRRELRPTAIRTADVLAACPYDGEFATWQVAETMGLPMSKLSGHLDFLVHAGRLARIKRGVYELTPYGRAVRGKDFGAAA